MTEPLTTSIVHRAPIGCASSVPCCGEQVFDLPRTDRMTATETVTCPGTGRDTCDDCPECRDEANWLPCCAACHCATNAIRCPICRTATED